MLVICDMTPCTLVKIIMFRTANKYTLHSAVWPQNHLCTTSKRHLHGLAFRDQN